MNMPNIIPLGKSYGQWGPKERSGGRIAFPTPLTNTWSNMDVFTKKIHVFTKAHQ